MFSLISGMLGSDLRLICSKNNHISICGINATVRGVISSLSTVVFIAAVGKSFLSGFKAEGSGIKKRRLYLAGPVFIV